MDFIPYSVVGFSHKFLDFIHLGGELGKVVKSFRKFTDDVLSSNRDKNDSSENTIINLLLNPKDKFSKKEIEDEMTMIAVAVSFQRILL